MTTQMQEAYFDAAQRLLEQAMGEPMQTRQALERLSADFFWRVVKDMTPANDT